MRELKERIKIRMLTTVYPDFMFLAKPGTVLKAGETYDAIANQNGAVSGICENGAHLGVKPEEFEFVEAPQRIIDIHKEVKYNA